MSRNKEPHLDGTSIAFEHPHNPNDKGRSTRVPIPSKKLELTRGSFCRKPGTTRTNYYARKQRQCEQVDSELVAALV